MSATARRIRAKLDQLSASRPRRLCARARRVWAVAAALSRRSKRGELKRLANGIYYRPMTGHFGPVPPMEAVVVAAVGATSGRLAPYPTGLAVYNALGFPAGTMLLTRPFLRNHPVTK